MDGIAPSRLSLSRDWTSVASANLIVAAAYIVFAEVGFSLAFGVKQVTAVWPPTGIAVAALLLLGYRVLPGIFLGALIANATVHEPVLTPVGIAIGNTAGPLLGVYLLRRFVGFDTRLERVRDVIGLAVLGAAVPMTITASNGVANLALVGIVGWSDYLPVWRLWWVGDAMGVLLFTPLILTVAARGKRPAIPGTLPEAAILALGIPATAWLAFINGPRAAYPLYPFVIWTALRFSQRAMAVALVVVASVAIWGTAHGYGPFASGALDQELLYLIPFLATLSITGLVLSAVIAERRSADSDLQATQEALHKRELQLELAERHFQVIAEAVPQHVWTADATGWIDWYNERWYEFTGQTKDESAGWGWQKAVHVDDYQRVMREWPSSIATGRPFEMELRIQRHDERFRWFLVRAEPLRAADGTIARWYGTNTDVDDQRRAYDDKAHLAESLQTAFLPARLPQGAGFRFDALYMAAGREALVGGDWYDAVELPTGEIVISIGDVIGHGIEAAVSAFRLRQRIFACAFDDPDPATILDRVNGMNELREDTVVTALVAILDSDMKRMRYASAGHPPPILAAPAQPPHWLEHGSIPIGVSILGAKTRTVELEPNAVILFYTDGIVEFRRDIESAEAALLKAVGDLVGNTSLEHPAAAVKRSVMGDARAPDDVALLLLQISPPALEFVCSDAAQLRKRWRFHSGDAHTAQASRHELIGFLQRFDITQEQLFNVELILGEVLANTVKHAPGLVNIEIDWTDVRPVVTVVDTGPGLDGLAAKLPEDFLSEEGRGLFLISKLAADLSFDSARGKGTTLRIVLPVARDITAA